MNTAHTIDTSVLSIHTLQWFLENITKQVSEAQRETFIQLKNSIEGWKKGTMVRACKQYRKSEEDKIRENLSLYLNQLSAANYSAIFTKIKNELDEEWSATSPATMSPRDVLFDIMFTNTIIQPNAITLLSRLIVDLQICEHTLRSLRDRFATMSIMYVERANYDNMCIANKNNVVFKNTLLFMAKHGILLWNDIEARIQSHLDAIRRSDEGAGMVLKEQVEGYVDCYVELLKEYYATIPRDELCGIHRRLCSWKSDKVLFTNRARFTIYDLYDTFEANGVVLDDV